MFVSSKLSVEIVRLSLADDKTRARQRGTTNEGLKIRARTLVSFTENNFQLSLFIRLLTWISTKNTSCDPCAKQPLNQSRLTSRAFGRAIARGMRATNSVLRLVNLIDHCTRSAFPLVRVRTIRRAMPIEIVCSARQRSFSQASLLPLSRVETRE
mgnify:CR=1 FL=1